jgi:hypothetical protein
MGGDHVRALSRRVAERWEFVSFRGKGKGEWRGVVDVVAIRKNTSQPSSPQLKRGDLDDAGAWGSGRHQALLFRLDLKRKVFRVDPALGEAAGDEPQAGLAGGHPHVAQFLLRFVDAPDGADALSDGVAEELADEVFEAEVAGREDD